VKNHCALATQRSLRLRLGLGWARNCGGGPGEDVGRDSMPEEEHWHQVAKVGRKRQKEGA